MQPSVNGTVHPGFENVRKAFIENFSERAEIGAACAVYYQGQCVVDLWGGFREKESQLPWQADTPALVFSATKGIVALMAAHWVSNGYLDYHDPIAQYWPEFAQNGKAHITLEMLLNHQAGLHRLDVSLAIHHFQDWTAFEAILARQTPHPGSGYAYHAQSIGWYLDALCRRVDPQHRDLSTYLQEEFAVPLGQRFFIGLPTTFPLTDLAKIYDYSLWKLMCHPQRFSGKFLRQLLNPWSETNATMRNPSLGRLHNIGEPPWCYVPLPGSNGIGTARSLACFYHMLVCDTGPVQLSPKIRERLYTDPPSVAMDRVVGSRTSYHLGWKQSGPLMGLTDAIFGFPGFGGAYACADLDRGFSYAYTPNRLGYVLWNDPRDLALRAALLQAEGLQL